MLRFLDLPTFPGGGVVNKELRGRIKGPRSIFGGGLFEVGRGKWGFAEAIDPRPGAAGLHLDQFTVPTPDRGPR